MRKSILTAAAAAFVLSTAGAGAALAQVSVDGVKNASGKKDVTAANTAGAKVAAKGAKKAAETAKDKAEDARDHAKKAADKAEDAAEAAGKSK